MKDKLVQNLINNIDLNANKLKEISLEIWKNPEIGYEEYFACKIITDFLEDNGFSVQKGIFDMDTSFIATYGHENLINIGLMCEYDALPKLGHACGHNLFSVSGAGAAVALSKLSDNLGFKITVVGCPAEEATVPDAGGKIILANNGVFDNLDIAMMCHAENETIIERGLVASMNMSVDFFGKSAHAGGSPEKGINALTSGYLTINNINAIRQHFTSGIIVNPIIKEGGNLANTIPDKCSVDFSIRAKERNSLYEIVDKVINCIKASAMVTGCSYEINKSKYPYEDLIPNHNLGLAFKDSLDKLGIESTQQDFRNYAWDVGNVSYKCPTLAPYIKIGEQSLVGHTDDFREASASEDGLNAMLSAAKALSITALEYIISDELREKVKTEFKQINKITK